MKSLDPGREILNAQQGHWERMFGKNEEMFGEDPSYPAIRAASTLAGEKAERILELGSGQGRDTLYFARKGFHVSAVDYSVKGLADLQSKVSNAQLPGSVTTVYHDVRLPLPFADDSFDGCYSHMLYCMALSTGELEFLSGEIRRVLKPGGLNIYTARHTGDPHYKRGIDRGDDMWEIDGGFIVHFFSREKVGHLAKGYDILGIEEFEETSLPKKLFLVALRKI